MNGKVNAQYTSLELPQFTLMSYIMTGMACRCLQWLQSAILSDYSWGHNKRLTFRADKQRSQPGLQSSEALPDRGSCTRTPHWKCVSMQFCWVGHTCQHMPPCLYACTFVSHVAFTTPGPCCYQEEGSGSNGRLCFGAEVRAAATGGENRREEYGHLWCSRCE